MTETHSDPAPEAPLSPRGVARNALWALAGALAPTLVMLVAVPLYLSFLGLRQYGVLAFATAITGLAGVLTLGMGEANTKLVAARLARGDREGAARIVWATLFFFGGAGIVGTGLLVLLAGPIAASWLDLSGGELERAVDVLRLAALGFPANVLISVATGVFEGQQRFHFSQGLSIGRSVLALVVAAVVLVLGAGIVHLMTALVATTWLSFAVALWAALRGLPRLGLQDLRLRGEVRELLGFATYTGLNSLGILAFGQLDKVLVASLLGLESMSCYTIAQGVASKLHVTVMSLSRALMPYFSAREARDGGAALAAPLLQSWRASILASMAGLGLALATAPWLLDVWVGPAVALRTLPAYILFLASYGLHAINIVPYYYLIGRGQPRLVTAATTLSGAFMLGTIGLLAPVAGLTGAAASSISLPFFGALMARRAIRITGAAGAIPIARGLVPPLLVHGVAAALALLAGTALARAFGRDLAGLLGAAAVFLACLSAAYLGLRRSANPYLETIWSIAARIRRRRVRPEPQP